MAQELVFVLPAMAGPVNALWNVTVAFSPRIMGPRGRAMQHQLNLLRQSRHTTRHLIDLLEMMASRCTHLRKMASLSMHLRRSMPEVPNEILKAMVQFAVGPPTACFTAGVQILTSPFVVRASANSAHANQWPTIAAYLRGAELILQLYVMAHILEVQRRAVILESIINSET